MSKCHKSYSTQRRRQATERKQKDGKAFEEGNQSLNYDAHNDELRPISATKKEMLLTTYGSCISCTLNTSANSTSSSSSSSSSVSKQVSRADTDIFRDVITVFVSNIYFNLILKGRTDRRCENTPLLSR